MKKGQILIESLIFLLLTLILFTTVLSFVSRLSQNQALIEKGARELSDITSISNTCKDGTIPESLIQKFTVQDNGGNLVYEYKSTVTGEIFRITKRSSDN